MSERTPDVDPLYRGRFAPSPTGPLHFGSLVAAVGSYLDARHHTGHWYVRIEDLDPPREVPGAADDILHTLDALGLHWDGEIMYQSRRHSAYEAALVQLQEGDWTFPCACSRKDIDSALGTDTPVRVYPGTCRKGLPAGRAARATRARVDDITLGFHDRIQGLFQQDLGREVGDFVVRRADGLMAYQLAVTVDDAEQQITDIVRGSDLLDSTLRQIVLQQRLGHARPTYAHLPVAMDSEGRKLSKQTGAAPVNRRQPEEILFAVLVFLGQEPPPELARGPLPTVLAWAADNWDLNRVPRRHSILHSDAEPVLSQAGRRKIE